VKSFKGLDLQLVFTAFSIVANYRHACQVHNCNSQLEVLVIIQICSTAEYIYTWYKDRFVYYNGSFHLASELSLQPNRGDISLIDYKDSAL